MSAEDEEELIQAVKLTCSDVEAAGLNASTFLVAWGGVLTLAFSAWPTPFRQLKLNLNNRAAWTERMACSHLSHLVAENDGSKWPKCSLAALKDGRELSSDELDRLRALCLESEKILGTNAGVKICSLTMVKYRCRSLEQRAREVPIACILDAGQTVRWDVNEEDMQLSSNVAAEFLTGDLTSYIAKINTGKNRIAHYRDPCEVEWTLVAQLGKQLVDAVKRFAAAVEVAVPGAYTFFDPASLHVTVRTLRRETETRRADPCS